MGTDIHLKVECKMNGKWKPLNPPALYPARDPWTIEQYNKIKDKPDPDPNGMDQYYIRKFHECWYDMRSYYTFSILASVRQQAHSDEDFFPIAYPRGLPDDLSEALRDENFGYHDFSWLTVKEMLDFNWQQVIRNCGYIDLEQFQERLAKNITDEPDGYCGGAGGPNTICHTEEEIKQMMTEPEKFEEYIKGKSVYVLVHWEQTYAKASGWFYNKVLPELAKLNPAHPEDVRIVFGFDS